MSQTTDLTIRKTIEVAAPPERAFEVFTAGIAAWWPRHTHSIGEERVEEVVCEPRVGGVVYEVLDDGTRQEWADVVAFDPPRGLAWDWRVNPERETTRVEVTFTASGDGTRVELVHSGWEGAEGSQQYDQGWDVVLERYAAAVAA